MAMHHAAPENCWGQMMNWHVWLDANVRGGGGGGGPARSRAKYKSSNMKRNFTSDGAACFYKHLTRTMPGVDLSRCMVWRIRLAGRRIKKLIDTTSIPQRASVMHARRRCRAFAVDQGELLSELYSGPDANPKYKETPYWNDRYEGYYINYPDCDMLAYPVWPELYYVEAGLVPMLKGVKQRYDSNNIFHNAMSIRS